jgi:hypothetical protein
MAIPQPAAIMMPGRTALCGQYAHDGLTHDGLTHDGLTDRRDSLAV